MPRPTCLELHSLTGWKALPSLLSQMSNSLVRIPVATLSRPLFTNRTLAPVAGKLNLVSNLHTSSACCAVGMPRGPYKFLKNNDVVYPPTPFGEKERHAFVCHAKENIKYSPKKMWYIASLVRGMKIDDAINQLKFVHKKGAVAARETLEEAQALAVKEHNVEYKSNLWVSESFVTKGMVIKGMRRHARRRFGTVRYRYCHYFVTLEEGEPPEHYYPHTRHLTGPEMLQQWMEDLRKRNIKYVI